MKKLMEQMAEELSAAFEKAGYDPSYGKVTVSNRPDLCEFQCNGAMAGAKAYKRQPGFLYGRSCKTRIHQPESKR